jgi:hypothetical protein
MSYFQVCRLTILTSARLIGVTTGIHTSYGRGVHIVPYDKMIMQNVPKLLRRNFDVWNSPHTEKS